MVLVYRDVNRSNNLELSFIAEMDTKTPEQYDPTYKWSTSFIQARIEMYKTRIKEDDFFQVAVFEKRIVGFNIVSKVPYPPDLTVGLVISLWVAPDFRGQSIATTLKDKSEIWAKNAGLDHIQTNVHINNKGMLALNEKFGFESFQYTMRKRLR